MKRTELYIFLDFLFAILFVAFLGTVPLVGPAKFFFYLAASVLAIVWGFSALGLDLVTCTEFISSNQDMRTRKSTIQFLDPLLI